MNLRWALSVSRAEVTDIHNTIVQGTVGGVFVDVLAQRVDSGQTWTLGAIPTTANWTGFATLPPR